MYGEAGGSPAAHSGAAMIGKVSLMAVSRLGVAAEVVVGDVNEAEPDREQQAKAPWKDHAPEDPGGHAEDERQLPPRGRRAGEVADAPTPHQRRQPDGQDEQAFATGVAEEALLFFGSHRIVPSQKLKGAAGLFQRPV